MTQQQRRLYLIQELLKEQPQYPEIELPQDEQGRKQLLRSLFNIRLPRSAGPEFLAVQDAYLQEEIRRKGITRLDDLQPVPGRNLPLARRYYHPGLRRDCQCGKQPDAGLFCTLP